MQFTHEVIDPDPPCGRLGFCLTTDLTGNGRPDVIVGGLGSQPEIEVLGKRLHPMGMPVLGPILQRRESNVFWYENPGWDRHEVVQSRDLSIGASLVDLTGTGRDDLVVGENGGHRLFWFEQPEDPRRSWQRHLITDDFQKYHDTATGDVDGDGEDELLVLSQLSQTVCYYDIPDDPYASPWPDDHQHVIADGIEVEGAAIADLDGDGRPEVVAGPNVFRRVGDGWSQDTVVDGWAWTRVAVGDLTGDGRQEIVVTEGDRPYHDGEPARLGIFTVPDHEPLLLEEGLVNPHTLQLADFTGSGSLDVYVAEMGLGHHADPRHLLFQNDGTGSFDRTVIHRGTPTHEAKAVDLTGDGRVDIVGKSFTPTHHVDAWFRSD